MTMTVLWKLYVDLCLNAPTKPDFSVESVQLSPTVSSTSPPRLLVGHTYAMDNHVPSDGEVIVVCLSQALSGSDSTFGGACDLPSHATRHNVTI
jgi:hypothetical protein